jgi:hypothetical protein
MAYIQRDNYCSKFWKLQAMNINYVRKIKLPAERWCQYYVRGNDLVYTSHLVLSDSEIQEDMMGWTCS